MMFWLFNLLFTCLSLRVKTDFSSDPEKVEPPNLAKSRQAHVLEIEEFKIKWEKFMGEINPNVSLPLNVRLVLGVFSTEGATAYQDVIRDTWMQHKGVCILSPLPDLNCSVYVAFVLGDHPTENTVLHSDTGQLVLNISENMNEGKSFTFFEHASRAYSWATHIGKMDMDVFPNLPLLLSSLRDPPVPSLPRCDVFVGIPNDYSFCGGFPSCPFKGCGSPIDNDFFKFNSSNKNCYTYLSGGFYLMSQRLAKNVSESGGYWDLNQVGIEDLQTGRAVVTYGQQVGRCIQTWNPKAWFHECDDRTHSLSWAPFIKGPPQAANRDSKRPDHSDATHRQYASKGNGKVKGKGKGKM